MEALVVTRRGSCTLEGKGIILFESTVPVMVSIARKLPGTVEVKYAASILNLSLDVLSLVHIHHAFFGQDLQFFLFLLGGVADYYVVQAGFHA